MCSARDALVVHDKSPPTSQTNEASPVTRLESVIENEKVTRLHDFFPLLVPVALRRFWSLAYLSASAVL